MLSPVFNMDALSGHINGYDEQAPWTPQLSRITTDIHQYLLHQPTRLLLQCLDVGPDLPQGA